MSYGTKPNEIRHPQAALLAEEYVCQRIQSLGYTADLNSEEVNQLTDPNVVEVVDADPTVSLTIDINEFGSINLYNQLAGFYGFPDDVNRVAWEYDFKKASVDNTNHRDGTISHTDFGEVATDFLVAIKDTEAATIQARALWFSNCFVDSVSGSYQVDGFASESISLTGTQQRWFLNSFASARIQKAVWLDADNLDTTGTGAPQMLTEDGILLPASYYAIGGSGFVSSGGYSFKENSRYRHMFLPASPSFPNIENDGANPIGGVKEGELELLMWDSNEFADEPLYGSEGIATQKMLRVQSVDYEISFDREDLKQLYTGTYYKGLNDSNITSTVTVLESNLELWALGTSNWADFTEGVPSVHYYSLSDFQSMSDIQLRIDVFNTKTYINHGPSTILKSIRLHDGKITSVSDSKDVPGRGTVTFDITFKRANYVGHGLSGR